MAQDPIEALRIQYLKGSLNRVDLHQNPIVQFKDWWNQALDAKVYEANAMILSTVVDNVPSSRTVLIKGITDQGLLFYTNYDSDKGKAIANNPNVAVCFLWKELQRQVRIEGTAHKISREKSQAYFQSRPRGSQLSAWTSPQSQIVSNRDVLHEWRDRIEMKFDGQEILPVPAFWGGYEIVINQIECWQGRANRLHDRFRYSRRDGEWQLDRLAP